MKNQPEIRLNKKFFCPISFVGESNFRQNVIDILEKYLLGSGRKNNYSYSKANPKSPTFTKNFYPNNLDDWYNNSKTKGIIKNLNISRKKRKKTYPQKEGFISASTLKVSTTNLLASPNGVMAGLDTPVWLDFDGIDWKKEKIKPNPKNSNERIMVISQDPRRDQDEMGYPTHSKCIALSTPFGWHDFDWRNGLNKDRKNGLNNDRKNGLNNLIPQIFKEVLGNKKVSLYFTDVYKLRGMEPANIDKSNIAIYKDILEQEIKLFKPDLIVAAGQEASKVLLKMNILVKILHIPHPTSMHTQTSREIFTKNIELFFHKKYTNNTNQNFVDACIDII